MSNGRGNIFNVFGNNRSPPPQQPDPAIRSQQQQPPQANITSIDDLFRGHPTSQLHQSPQPSSNTTTTNTTTSQRVSSASTTPVSSVTANSAGSILQQTDNRQNALLSTLFGSVQHQPSSVPTSSSVEASPPSSENQGRVLLEQLMSKQPNQPNQTPGTQPQYPSPYTSPPQQPIPPPMVNLQQVPSAPSPPRKSMFDFVSPFDALAASNPPSSAAALASGKRKPVPGHQSSNAAQAVNDDPAVLNAASQSPTRESFDSGDRRTSVENLIDSLSIGPSTLRAQPANLVNKPTQDLSRAAVAPASKDIPPPDSSSTNNPLNQSFQSAFVPVPGTETPTPTTSPVARDLMNQPSKPDLPTDKEWRISDPKPKPKATNKEQGSSISSRQKQVITFDVSQALENIQAPPESSLSTPIALVKVEPTFLPGSTIGATSWIAYAMTRGRVRVISRASGDRTLLQLPSAFPPTTSVVDMAVFGNRLAGVTSDGGFVVWELPQVIVDDVPGKLLLCVVPPPGVEALRSVRWHPKKPDTVAVASESHIYLININEASRRFGSDPVAQSDLIQVGPVMSLSSPLVAFAFDVPHLAIATISEDSTLELWQISNQLPFWSATIPGDDVPSSIDFLEGGIVIGRKSGTVFQLLPVMDDTVLSTLKFIDTQNKDDRDMFGHVAYDSRIQTLWIANSRRESLIGVKIAFDTVPQAEERVKLGYFDQVAEFVGPKPSIHFVILTADSDPHGDEAHAACIASKVPPGPLAMVAFSVHAQGVDQIIIRKEWFDNALLNAPSKHPSTTNPFQQTTARTAVANLDVNQPPVNTKTNGSRSRSPTLEDGEADSNKDDNRSADKTRNQKLKGVAFKDKEEAAKEGRDKEKPLKSFDSASALEGNLWSKDLRKLEENLHTRVGRTIGKELEKQQQRLEDARAADQSAEVARQEKIIKLISTELTKNTTRVVEVAVKSEIQQSVLPALENITRNEVKAAMNGQVVQTLPGEIERLFLRPDFSNHMARTLASAVTPTIERLIKDAVTKTIIPIYKQESSNLHQELTRELHSEILGIKNDVMNWQNEALRNQETGHRDLEQLVRGMQEQIKYLSLNVNTQPPPVSQHVLQHRASPVPQNAPHPQLPSHLRGHNLPSSNYNSTQVPFQQPSVNPSWFATQSHVPLMTQAMAPNQATSQAVQGGNAHTEPPKEDWDETYLAVLGTQDPRQLRDLLARSDPDVIMPSNGTSPLSQAVVLTLIHRLSAAVGETSPVEEAFKASLWWLQRSANSLNTTDPLISPYVGRVLPTVQNMLNTTKSRLSLLPGGPPLLEASRVISEVQEIVARKSGV